MRINLQEQIHSILSEVLNEPSLDANNPERQHTANWDSLRHMELIMRLEEEFQVRFSFKEAAAMQSLNDIVQILEVKL
ncbi:acyl carrier protein [Paenibacillus sp. GCM10027626]|uniref:acyl carrier protein n=1 Tax=Paenibacillus sp. GCM10027626 TaxID=3273411 RepID=UPI00362605C0